MQVILALLRCSWTCTASFVFSSKFHTSMLPSSFPMKKTAGLERDQHPAEYVCSEFADRMMGPSWSLSRGKEHTTWWAVFYPGWRVSCYARVKWKGFVTITSSLQIAKFHSPTVKMMFLKKGDRCTVFTIQWWTRKQWRGLVPATEGPGCKIPIGDIYIWDSFQYE